MSWLTWSRSKWLVTLRSSQIQVEATLHPFGLMLNPSGTFEIVLFYSLIFHGLGQHVFDICCHLYVTFCLKIQHMYDNLTQLYCKCWLLSWGIFPWHDQLHELRFTRESNRHFAATLNMTVILLEDIFMNKPNPLVDFQGPNSCSFQGRYLKWWEIATLSSIDIDPSWFSIMTLWGCLFLPIPWAIEMRHIELKRCKVP